jgi:hypothetical protein
VAQGGRMPPRLSVLVTIFCLVPAASASANGVAATTDEPERRAMSAPRTPTVSGARARLRSDGLASIPEDAPQRVRAVIAAANDIVGKPYKWGGGHGSIVDDGYDCSGAVSYALISAGLLDAPLSSGLFASVLEAGAGQDITVYGNAEHAYLEVAGLRLDTSSYGDPGGLSGVRWRPAIGQRAGFLASHP